jgi:hypothetical protein
MAFALPIELNGESEIDVPTALELETDRHLAGDVGRRPR